MRRRVGSFSIGHTLKDQTQNKQKTTDSMADPEYIVMERAEFPSDEELSAFFDGQEWERYYIPLVVDYLYHFKNMDGMPENAQGTTALRTFYDDLTVYGKVLHFRPSSA